MILQMTASSPGVYNAVVKSGNVVFETSSAKTKFKFYVTSSSDTLIPAFAVGKQLQFFNYSETGAQIMILRCNDAMT